MLVEEVLVSANGPGTYTVAQFPRPGAVLAATILVGVAALPAIAFGWPGPIWFLAMAAVVFWGHRYALPMLLWTGGVSVFVGFVISHGNTGAGADILIALQVIAGVLTLVAAGLLYPEHVWRWQNDLLPTRHPSRSVPEVSGLSQTGTVLSSLTRAGYGVLRRRTQTKRDRFARDISDRKARAEANAARPRPPEVDYKQKRMDDAIRKSQYDEARNRGYRK